MNFLKLIIRAPRPNRVIDMPASVNRFFCRKGFAAITLFGHIFTGEQLDADRLNKGYTYTKNHEMIHLRQAQNTHNSWFLFYILYLWHSLLALRYFRKTKNAAYYLNPFEMEAYLNTRDLQYIEKCGDEGACQWRTFSHMSLAKRLQLLKEHHIV